MTSRKKILAHYSDYGYTAERKKLNAYGPLGYYRIVKPAQQIKDHDVTIVGNEINMWGVSVDKWKSIYDEFDVFWTGYFSEEVAASSLVYWRNNLKGKKFIIDIDDNYLDIPETNHLYDRFKRTKRDRAMLGTLLSFADAITVSTYPLKERIAQHMHDVYRMEKPIFVIPNMSDVDDWKVKPAPKFKDKIVIGYAASNSHHDDIKMFAPALKKIMEMHPNVHFQAIGTVEKDKIPEYFRGFTQEMLDRIWLGRAESVFKKFPKVLAQQKWDIGIAPLVDSAFTRSKSHIKWMEYAMIGLPTVASRVYPYYMPIKGKKTIEDGVTGVLARPNEWVEKLDILIKDKKLRRQIGKNALQAVIDNWQYKNGTIGDTINEVVETIYKNG